MGNRVKEMGVTTDVEIEAALKDSHLETKRMQCRSVNATGNERTTQTTTSNEAKSSVELPSAQSESLHVRRTTSLPTLLPKGWLATEVAERRRAKENVAASEHKPETESI